MIDLIHPPSLFRQVMIVMAILYSLTVTVEKHTIWAFTAKHSSITQRIFSSYPLQTIPRSTHISTNIFKPASISSATSSTQLYFGVLLPVPDDFFTISGVTLGVAYTLTRSINRVLIENIAWEKRLDDARLLELEMQDEALSYGSTGVSETEFFTELDLRKRDSAVSKSAYGPSLTDDNEQFINSRDRRRTKVLDRDKTSDYDDDFKKYTSRMTDDQIRSFEKEWSVKYDPYYDEPYTKDELPEDEPFVDDKFYGDRRYKNGEIFYRDENNPDLYWRSGGRPRLRQFWEMF